MGILEKLGLYAIVAGVIVIIAGGIYGRYEWVMRENERAKERLVQSQAQTRQVAEVAAANKAEFDKLNQRFDALDKVMAERAAREQALQASVSGMRRDLNELKKRDPAVQQWSDQPVPGAIAERLRADPGSGAGPDGDSKGQAAGKPDSAVPHAGVVGTIKRGLVRVLPRAPAKAPGLQPAAR